MSKEKTKRKNRKRDFQKDKRDSAFDACLLDGCFYWHIGDGCFDFDGGCIDFDGGCFDIGGACTVGFFFPLRFIVIIGLMLYGDWDFANGRAK